MHNKLNYQLLFCCFVFAAILFISTSFLSAAADNQAIYLSPGQIAIQDATPPPGDGNIAPPVTPGDSQWQAVPTNNSTTGTPDNSLPSTADNSLPSTTSGTSLTASNEMCVGKINLLLNEPTKGTHVVLTFQPGSLTQQQVNAMQNILGATTFDNSQPYQNILVSQPQLTAMQNALFPYPAAGISAVPMKDGTLRSWISTDSPATGYPQYASTNIQPVLKVIPKYCRYLVILGMVCACLFLIFAAKGIIFGQHNAGGMAIGTIGGMMLLLMSYSIWKVIRFNAVNARGQPVPVSNSVSLPSSPMPLSLNPMPLPSNLAPLPSRGYTGDFILQKAPPNLVPLGQTNVPVVPNAPAAVNRSGLPLEPLGAVH